MWFYADIETWGHSTETRVLHALKESQDTTYRIYIMEQGMFVYNINSFPLKYLFRMAVMENALEEENEKKESHFLSQHWEKICKGKRWKCHFRLHAWEQE